MRSMKDVRHTGKPILVTVLAAGFLAFSAGIACSPDVTGLGNFDAGAAGRPGSGTGGAAGRPGNGTGGAAGRPGNGTGGAAGRPGNGTGGVAGRVGDGGSTGAGGTAGRPGSGTGGTAGHTGQGGRTGAGSGGTAAGGGGAATASGGNGGAGGVAVTGAGGAVGSGGHQVGSGGTGDGGGGGRGVGGAAGRGDGGRGAAGGTGGRGSGGRGGRSGGSGTGGSPADPECTDASDCRLDSDCCVCEAVPASSPPAVSCALECLQSHCSALRLLPDAPACAAGRCVAGFTCDDANVTCKSAVPTCAAGQVAGVTVSGECYTGSCVPAAQCTTVPGCSACGPHEACVIYETQRGNQYHCVSVPDACNGDETCDCLGPSVCTGSFRSCTNLSGQRAVMCSCPTC